MSDPGYTLVIDLECTCSDASTPPEVAVPRDAMEIIEIGAVVSTAEGEVLDRFGRFVRPVEHPVLTAFCTELTTIRQADVDKAEPLGAVLRQLAIWLTPTLPRLASWGSWGAFDCNQLTRECERKGVESPLATLPHVNLKAAFAKRRRIRQVGMTKALAIAGLPHAGQHHRGLDDAVNIARLIPHCTPQPSSLVAKPRRWERPVPEVKP